MDLYQSKTLLQQTIPFAKEYIVRSTYEVLISFSLLLGCITAALLTANGLIKALLIIPSGLVVVRCFILFHDYQHKAILRKSSWAKYLFDAFGVLIFTPPKVWRDSHNFHHAHNAILETSHIGSYWTMTVEKWHQLNLSQKRLYRIVRSPLVILFGLFTVFIFDHCIRSFFSNPKKYPSALLTLLVHIIGISVCIYHNINILVVWYLPLMLAACLGSYLFYAQHNFVDTEIATRGQWNYVNAAIHSSCFIEMPKIMHWFTGNIAYHHVHHLNHRIPFYRLPAAMNEIEALRKPARTSLSLSGIVACLRLKLWDEKQQRLIEFSDVT